jgi:DNA ligase D-like protein (predicted ligase)
MKCLPVAKLPEGSAWAYELKFDGYRALGIKSTGRVRLLSRNEKDLSARFPSIAQALARLPDETVVDGEIVAFDDNGRPSFNVLQNSLSSNPPLAFYVFDLIAWRGRDMTRRALDERRDLLRKKLMPRLAEPIRYSETVESPVDELLDAVRAEGLEGVIAKQRDSLYERGRRSGAWVKMRVNQGQEFVIAGYTPAPRNFDALLVGYYEGKKLIYAARVRNGFVPRLREAVFKRFRGLETDECPFANLPEPRKGRWGEGLTTEDMKRCRWLKPRLVAAFEYLEWTPADHLRHPKFIGLREDKSAPEVGRENL